MLRLILIGALLIASSPIYSQKLKPVSPVSGEAPPAWAKEMVEARPNIWRVDEGFNTWRALNTGVKTTFSQYYKKWRRSMLGKIDRYGYEVQELPSVTGHPISRKSPLWHLVGPLETFSANDGANPRAVSSQVNVYCFDQSISNPDIVYCGTEGAEVFRSSDRGMHWECVSRSLSIAAPGALEVHPSNPQIVLLGEGNHIHYSADAGANWDMVLSVPDLYVNEMVFHPSDPSIALAATNKGLFRSDNGGQTWQNMLPQAVYDVVWKTDGSGVAFLAMSDPAARICRFLLSTDFGNTWVVQSEGWFESYDPDRQDGGARLAVTDADPNRLYAVLIGEGKAGDDGFIGVYRSNDGGNSWTLPNAPAGAPYNETNHPNMATIGRTGGYHQGFYNLGFDVSDTNPDELLIGFLNLWRSKDGAYSFECMGGYCNNPFNYVHPDCQEIEINGPDVWMCSDGGIEHSDDFFDTHFARNKGISSSDFWGFGSGWNTDLLVGGRYHNGNTAWHENWQPGDFASLGGGEAPTGYVSPGDINTAYFSDIGGTVIPAAQNGFTRYFGFGRFPVESYYPAESGEIEWDPRCWNHLYVSKSNQLWHSTDGGIHWESLYTFGIDPLSNALSFEISRSNPDVIYLFQRAAYSWDTGLLWKSVDGGHAWTTVSLPPGYARRVMLSLDPEDHQRLWVVYADGDNGQKIFQTKDGGFTWINTTTPTLDGQGISHFFHQGGTEGGVYLGTYQTVFYRNEALSDWVEYREGLPATIATCLLRPFYRDGKIRMAAYGKGIWEAPLYEPSKPIAQPMVNKRLVDCPGDTLQFDDFSILDHSNATWLWSFPGGSPETSQLRNPRVTYQQPGAYDVTLTVTNNMGSSTKTIPGMVEVALPVVQPPALEVNFSLGYTPLELVNPDGGVTWEPIVLYGCKPEGDTAVWIHNYVYSGYGRDFLILPAHIDLTQSATATLSFDLAYAPYYDGNAFIDSFFVELTSDCGNSTQTIFRSGGEQLSTTTSGIGPNGLYEYDEFVPATCEEWKHIELDLTPFAGKYVTIGLVSQSGYGNNLYLDNLKLHSAPLSSTESLSLKTRLSIFPNPAGDYLHLAGVGEGNNLVEITDINGRLMHRMTVGGQPNWQRTLPLNNYPSGWYCVRMKDDSGRPLSVGRFLKM
jgi:photosystem II stability/assembly factor-like uncharacterized protein